MSIAEFNQPFETEILIEIRRCVQSGLAIGNLLRQLLTLLLPAVISPLVVLLNTIIT